MAQQGAIAFKTCLRETGIIVGIENGYIRNSWRSQGARHEVPQPGGAGEVIKPREVVGDFYHAERRGRAEGCGGTELKKGAQGHRISARRWDLHVPNGGWGSRVLWVYFPPLANPFFRAVRLSVSGFCGGIGVSLARRRRHMFLLKEKWIPHAHLVCVETSIFFRLLPILFSSCQVGCCKKGTGIQQNSKNRWSPTKLWLLLFSCALTYSSTLNFMSLNYIWSYPPECRLDATVV